MSIALAASSFTASASARPTRAESVLVLEAPNEAGWREGVQALMAELLTTGYELNVRVARARSLDQLEQELQLQLAESGALAGVSVTREGTSTTTLLCRRDAAACERLEVEIADDGELSRSRLALAVVGRLRPLDLPGEPEPVSSPPPRVPPSAKPARAEPPAPKRAREHQVWLGGGAVLTSGASTPLSWLGASFATTLAAPWGLELGFGGSPWRARAESRAGTLFLSGLQATGFVTFEQSLGSSFGFAVGVGGGALRLQETATAAPGFDAYSRSVMVGTIGARARLFRRFGPLAWGLSVDPSLLVPTVKVVAGTETVLQVGRPWVTLQTSVGFEL